MDILVTINPSSYKLPEGAPVYFDCKYSTIQDHEKLILVESDNKKLHLLGSISHQKFHSLSNSPFGGVTGKDGVDFLRETGKKFKSMNVKSLSITCPPPFYQNFLPPNEYHKAGFQKLYSDINQHIDLTNNIDFHSMELRKLKKAQQSELLFNPSEDIEEIHRFLSKCRQQQGLKINIDNKKLTQLFETFPNKYKAFKVSWKDQIIASLITVNVTEDIVYYFLPGSDKSFNHLSPMVFLVNQLIQILRSDGKKILDLGVSSVQGDKQEGLHLFKSRLGAIDTDKPTFQLNL